MRTINKQGVKRMYRGYLFQNLTIDTIWHSGLCGRIKVPFFLSLSLSAYLSLSVYLCISVYVSVCLSLFVCHCLFVFVFLSLPPFIEERPGVYWFIFQGFWTFSIKFDVTWGDKRSLLFVITRNNIILYFYILFVEREGGVVEINSSREWEEEVAKDVQTQAYKMRGRQSKNGWNYFWNENTLTNIWKQQINPDQIGTSVFQYDTWKFYPFKLFVLN